MLILMLLMEGIVLCFILLMFCVIGIANGPEKFTVFYEKKVQEKAIKLEYYIPTKMKIVKWLGTIVGFAIIALIIALIMSKIV